MNEYFLAGYYVEDEGRDYKIRVYNEDLNPIEEGDLRYYVGHDMLELPDGARIDCYRVEVKIRYDRDDLPSHLIPRQICFSVVGDNLLSVYYLNLTTINNMESMFRGCGNFLGFNWWPEAGEPFSKTNAVDRTSYMFEGCRALTHLDLSMLDTAKVLYMSGMFQGCESLEEICMFKRDEYIPDIVYGWDTSNVKSMASMFEGCRALTHLDLSRFNTSNVNEMYAMFKDCSSLEGLCISNHEGDDKIYEWDTSNVKEMGSMFEGCERIEHLPVDIFNMMGVEHTDCMFKNCTSLRGIKFNDHFELVSKEYYPYERLVSTNEMFYNCTSLEELEIPHFDIDEVTAYEKDKEFITEMRDMFYNCHSLNTIVLESFKVSGSGYRELALRTFFELLRTEAPNLKHIRIPYLRYSYMYSDIWDMGERLNMSGLFENLTELIEVDLKGWNTKRITDMARMFKGCTKLEYVNIDGWDLSDVIYADSMFEDCNTMPVIIHEDKLLFKKIASANQMFKNCSHLMELRFNEECVFESLTVANEMFYGCGHMSVLEIPNFDVRRVGTAKGVTGLETDMHDIFKDCHHLETLKLNNFKIDNETYSPSDIPVDTKTEFGDCRFEYFFDALRNDTPNLKHIEMKNFDNPALMSMHGMFRDFTNVETIDLSWCSTENIIDMSEMFANCSNLNGLDLSGFNTSNVINMSYMFNNCSSLDKLDLTSFDTRQVIDMSGMFENTESLTQGFIGDFDYQNVKTLSHLFYNSGLKVLPPYDYDTAHNVEDVSFMFGFCKNLTNASNIGVLCTDRIVNMTGMFWGCKSLSSIDVRTFNTSNVVYMNCMFKDCKALYALDLSSFDTSNVESYESMFEGCESITELDLSNFIRTHKLVIYSYMFKDCKNLERVDIGGLTGGTKDSTAADRMFEGCEKLSYIDMSNFRYDIGNFNNSMDVFRDVGINVSDNVLNVGMLYINSDILCRSYAQKLTNEVHESVKRINIYVDDVDPNECMFGIMDPHDRVRFIKYAHDGVERVDLPISIPAGCKMYWDSNTREYYIVTSLYPKMNTGIHEKIKIPTFHTMMYLDFNPKDEYVNGEYDVDYVKVQIPMKEKIEEESDK